MEIIEISSENENNSGRFYTGLFDASSVSISDESAGSFEKPAVFLDFERFIFVGRPRFRGANSFSVRQISGLEYKFGNPSAKVASGKKPAALDPMRTIQMKLNLVLAN